MYRRSNFNCTIQELKYNHHDGLLDILVFQLHHTGIKMTKNNYGIKGDSNFNCTIQELKYCFRLLLSPCILHFNCTIQELKWIFPVWKKLAQTHFNCTIQELKCRENMLVYAQFLEFQLHHTGIKITEILFSQTKKSRISIAPYRN